MFWHLSVFRRHSQQDPDLIACGKETVLVKNSSHKKQGKDLEVNDGEWTGKMQTKTWKKFLAVGEENLMRSFILTYSRP